MASLAAAIPRMQQISIRTRHPMSQDLSDLGSNHPVVQALRLNRDKLIQELGEQPEDTTIPTISEMITSKSSQNLQRILSERLSKHRRARWYDAADTPSKVRIDSSSGKDSAAWLLALPRTTSLTVDAFNYRTIMGHRLGTDLPGIHRMKCRCKCSTRNKRGDISTPKECT